MIDENPQTAEAALREARRAALADLVQSPGWEILRAEVEKTWSDAQVLRLITQAYEGIGLGREDEKRDAGQQILFARSQVLGVFTLPESLMRALAPKGEPRSRRRRV